MSFKRLGAWSGNGILLNPGQVVIYAGAISKCRVKIIHDKSIHLEVIEITPRRRRWANVGHIFKAHDAGLIWVLALSPEQISTGSIVEKHPWIGKIAICSQGIEFRITGRQQLKWGLAWVGEDMQGNPRASRNPTVIEG